MRTRDKLGALIGAVLLATAFGSTALAAPPTYTIAVNKTATPNVVGVGGADVVFTITVQNTGTGSFSQVAVTDTLVGCTLSAPTGTGAPTTLASGDTWTFTCTVTGVLPDTTNTANVSACHNNSGACSQNPQRTSGSASVTVTLDTEATLPPPTDTPAPTGTPAPTDTAAPTGGATASPAGGGGGATDQPTMAPTNSALNGGSGPADGAWLMVVALGVLLASVVILSPARAKHRS
jgi:uncharacterized repeat protein (TIGR01451 family)